MALVTTIIKRQVERVIDNTRKSREEYKGENIEHYDAVLNLHREVLTLAEATRTLTRALEINLNDTEQTAEALVKLTEQVLVIADHLTKEEN